MEQDANRIMDNLSAEWAQDLANAKRKNAILTENVRLLAEENEKLKKALDKQVEGAETPEKKGRENNDK